MAALRARGLVGEFFPPDLFQYEVEALLECIENGRPCPVFGPTEDRQARFEVRKPRSTAARRKGMLLSRGRMEGRALL